VDIQALSCESLAYLGDAVWELHVRVNLLWPPRRMRQTHTEAVARVRAQTQASLVVKLQPHLDANEQDWVRRGRNASGKIPRHLDPATYRLATGLETLLGYLYLTSPERLEVILDLCDEYYHHVSQSPAS
jgi:ribonuclease III family protein